MVDKSRKIGWRVIPVALLFVVVIPLVAFWMGKMTDMVLGLPEFPPFPFNLLVGPGVLLVGFGVAWGAIYQLFRRGRGLPWGDVDNPAQSTQLVTTGLYAYTRNPMILGFLILLSGIGWVVQSISAILIIPLVAFILLWVWLKRREEPQLEQRFGEAYRAYKESTPLIIPRPWRRARKTSEAKK